VKITSIENYLDTLHPDLLWWTHEVMSYIEKTYDTYPVVLFYQRPTIKIKKQLFIMLGGGKTHFSLYTTDFEYVEDHKLLKLPKVKYGKSAILFPLEKRELITEAYKVIDEVITRSQ
jgi:hypothetical protein